MNIFVGNLSGHATEKELENIFAPFGEIKSVKIIIDSYSGRSKGFAFVEMHDGIRAQKAIETLNSSLLHGQSLTVNEARGRSSFAG